MYECKTQYNKKATLVIRKYTSKPRLKQESATAEIWNEILWCEGVLLECGGVGKWVVSGNEGVNRGRGICSFLSVCLVYSTG